MCCGGAGGLDRPAAFERVAGEGSFGRAAPALGVGQPAVSARIQALEDDVGGALFNRGRRIALPALGESFLPNVRRALEVLRQGAESARVAQAGKRARARLGRLGCPARGPAAPALPRFAT